MELRGQINSILWRCSVTISFSLCWIHQDCHVVGKRLYTWPQATSHLFMSVCSCPGLETTERELCAHIVTRTWQLKQRKMKMSRYCFNVSALGLDSEQRSCARDQPVRFSRGRGGEDLHGLHFRAWEYLCFCDACLKAKTWRVSVSPYVEAACWQPAAPLKPSSPRHRNVAACVGKQWEDISSFKFHFWKSWRQSSCGIMMVLNLQQSRAKEQKIPTVASLNCRDKTAWNTSKDISRGDSFPIHSSHSNLTASDRCSWGWRLSYAC